MKRLQVILDDMGHLEWEIFEQEYADINRYKMKQGKHVKKMEMMQKQLKFGKYLFPPSGLSLF